jgi:microcystin-dependent protein
VSNPYVGEIRLFAGNFAPAGWAFCEGQLMAISENETLFNLIGTTYGGDGESTFALPDLRGRVPVHQGNGLVLAESGGVESVTLTTAQMPAHGHTALASTAAASAVAPANHVLASASLATITPYGSDAPRGSVAPQAVTAIGGSQPHDNTQPFLCVNFIISLFGIYPSPS